MTRRLKSWRSAVALGAVGVLLVACSGGSGQEDEDSGQEDESRARFDYDDGMFGAQQEPGDIVDGGTLSYAAYSEPVSLDPAISNAEITTGGAEMAAIFDTLLRYDTGSQDFTPQLAESVEPNEDFTQWTLTLRDDVQFSDGTLLDSAAVKASQKRYAAAPAPESALWNNNIRDIKTPDENTVVYDLQGSWSTFPAILSTGPGMIVAESAGSVDEDFDPIGAGPFTLEHQRPGEELVLARNEQYWDGAPHLELLRFVYLNDPAAVEDSLKGGSVQAAYFKDPDVVEKVTVDGYPGYANIVGANRIMIINAEDGRPGADPRVRSAMQHAIDPEMIRDRLYDGYGIASPLLFPEHSRWHSDDMEEVPHDPDEAKRLLEEAKADGYDGKITYLAAPAESATDGAQAVKAALESVGFDVDFDLLPTVNDQINLMGVEQDYDFAIWSLNVREADPFSRLYPALHSDGNLNYGMVTSDKMDAAIEELQSAPDDEASQEVITDIQSIWNEQIPFLQFMPAAEVTVWDQKVHGIKGASNSIILFDKAWIEE